MSPVIRRLKLASWGRYWPGPSFSSGYPFKLFLNPSQPWALQKNHPQGPDLSFTDRPVSLAQQELSSV